MSASTPTRGTKRRMEDGEEKVLAKKAKCAHGLVDIKTLRRSLDRAVTQRQWYPFLLPFSQ